MTPPTRLGRYELLARLATGGMGEIFLARLDGAGGFEKLTVIKRLLPELVASPQFVTMFLDEARIAAKLSHPNVCEVYELGQEDNQYYIAMQYLEGVPYTSAMDLDGDAVEHARMVAGLLQQACEGLHHAHELRGNDGGSLNLVHRDVSPSNLFVTTDGVLKLLDFGIAKARGATSETEVGTVKGKYSYMSPEQVRGGELDRRSDIFSAGIVLWESITGKRLFKRDSDYLVAKAILEEPVPRADAAQPSAPAALADVAAKALAHDPEDRYATAREMATAIAAAAATFGGAATATTIAAAVESRFADELREQRERYDRATGVRSRVPTDPPGLPPQPTPATVPMRGGPPQYRIPYAPAGRGERRTAVIALAVGALAVATAAMILASRGSANSPASPAATASPPAAAQPPADAAPVREHVVYHELIHFDAAPPPAPDAGAPRTPRRDETRSVRNESTRHGYLTIDSEPYASIYVDGKRIGVTPLIRKKLPAGRRKIKAVLESGRSQTFSVTIRPGKETPPQQLSW